jgi:hypothetical protein
MRRRRLRRAAGAPEGAVLDLLLQPAELPGEPVDHLPLRGDGRVQILDHGLLLGQANLEAALLRRVGLVRAGESVIRMRSVMRCLGLCLALVPFSASAPAVTRPDRRMQLDVPGIRKKPAPWLGQGSIGASEDRFRPRTRPQLRPDRGGTTLRNAEAARVSRRDRRARGARGVPALPATESRSAAHRAA